MQIPAPISLLDGSAVWLRDSPAGTACAMGKTKGGLDGNMLWNVVYRCTVACENNGYLIYGGGFLATLLAGGGARVWGLFGSGQLPGARVESTRPFLAKGTLSHLFVDQVPQRERGRLHASYLGKWEYDRVAEWNAERSVVRFDGAETLKLQAERPAS